MHSTGAVSHGDNADLSMKLTWPLTPCIVCMGCCIQMLLEGRA